MLKERANKKNNKELLKKQKKKPAGFKLAKPILLVFLAAANSGILAQLFSVLTSTRASSRLALQQPWTHRFRYSPSSGLWVCALGAFSD